MPNDLHLVDPMVSVFLLTNPVSESLTAHLRFAFPVLLGTLNSGMGGRRAVGGIG